MCDLNVWHGDVGLGGFFGHSRSGRLSGALLAGSSLNFNGNNFP